MSMDAVREAFRLLKRMPLLWVPGIIAGLFAAGLWILANTTGLFFTSRMFIISGLVLMIFIAGMIAMIKNNEGDIMALIRGGLQYYFRVLLPQLVILFGILLIFILLIVTFGFAGMTPDPQFIGLLTIFVVLPSLILTFFFDTAAVFEDRKVFASIQRSIELVSANMTQVIIFILTGIVTIFLMIFCLMILWEIALFSKLEPLTQYTDAQMRAITPEQLLAILGPDGVWITAAVLCLAGILIVPFFYAYKTCFYRQISGRTPEIRQVSGEYDAKGRWYKY